MEKRAHNVRTVLGIAAGGALAALARIELNRLLDPNLLQFPWATLTANAVGCLLIGLLSGYASRRSLSPVLLEAVRTGFIGGFTTFSAFSVETIHMIEAGHALSAAVYVLSSIILGFALTLLGMRIGRREYADA
jgi:fluoride exporter